MTTRNGSPPTSQPDARADAPKGALYSLRVRLLSVVALALSPLLALSFAQAYVEYHQVREDRQARLILAARRAAETADTIITGAKPLLEAIGSQPAVVSGGAGCTDTFRTVLLGVQSYSNIVRVDADDRLACSALPFEDGDGVGGGDWLERLHAGADFAVSEVFTGSISHRAVMLAGVPVRDAAGRYNGAVAASIDVGLIPRLSDPELGAGGVLALADRSGRIFSNGEALTVAAIPPETIEAALDQGGSYWDAPSTEYQKRDFVVAPLVGDAVFVVISTEQLPLIDWAFIDIGGTVLLPISMWLLALTAVALATDRMVLRWIAYLRRIADLYAAGRLRVEPVRAREAPVEIRELAETLDQMANRIAAREAELQDTLDQKTALLKEIHHRVKNNLQIIISLLNIQISSADDPTIIATLDDARARINALALVHKSLYEADDLRLIPLKPFFEELMMQLSSVMGASGPGIVVDLDVDPMALTTEGAVPLALFATECATNAFKHAFDGRSEGKVRVRLRRANGEARLDVEDDGVGWTQESDRRGVGASLMGAFARQLGGTMQTGASELGGARVTLTFPVAPEQH